MTQDIRPIGSPFKSMDYRPSQPAARLLNQESVQMAKTNPQQPMTTPVPPAPAGKVRTAFGTVTDPVPVPTTTPIPDIDFGDEPKLNDVFDGKPFDPNESSSPDEQDSHIAEPPLPETVASDVNTSPSHWSRIPAQMKQFTDFVAGLLNDYALFDHDELGAEKDWTVDSYLEKRSIDLSFYPTFTAARKSLDGMLLGEFKDDLKAIMIEKKCPKDLSTPLALIGHETIEDGIRAMTGNGVRTAITGKLRSLEQAQEIEATNAAMQRTVDEQKAQATEPPARNLPAVVTRPQNGNLPSMFQPTGNQAWDVQVMKAQMMIASGLLPKEIRTIEQVLTIGMMGEQLGIPMIVAVNNIDVIQGRPAIKPQLMLALIRRSGLLQDMSVSDDGETCTVKMTRKGEAEHVSTFSKKDAIAMGKTTDQWVKQPATMRKWRAISAACRVVFPDIIWGFYTPEELDPNAVVTED